ncbi:sodium:solute symporter family transporter [Anditalea andensis]|uniref:Sodium:solute symporter n=1 Tax=Anditalea andensis TaxID=1048983 RepID=A0A074L7A9_9BACT|nr:sodium/solute symporter [Anditalea andensis]KEO75728.1 sodium:solute symporter [Anditalea andensis]
MLIASAPSFELATIDIVIVLFYILFILALGFYVGRKEKSSDSFFLGGKSSTWPLVGFGLIAANLSGTSYLGLAGAGYYDGISVWNYEWMATILLIFFTIFILPFYIRSNVQTIPEYLEKRFDSRSRYAFSGFSIFTAMFIDSAGALFAGSITLSLIFPEVPMWVLIVGLTFLGGIYVVMGGLRAVMITDTIQGFLLLTAGGIIFYFCFRELGSWQAVIESAPEDGFKLFKPTDDDFMPWPGVFTGVLWLGIYYWTTNHVVVQKVLSAKSMDHGRGGVLFAAFIQLPFLFLLILPGVMGRELYPGLEDPDQIWPVLAFDFLPIGIRGLVFAALAAALMSSLDSVLNGASSLVVNDFLKAQGYVKDEKRLLTYGRITVGILMVVAALWAPVIFMFDGLVAYFQSFIGHITMPVVVIYMGGLFWRGATKEAAFYTLVIGAPIGLLAFLGNEIFDLYHMQFLYSTGIMLVFSVVLFVIISLATKEPLDEDKVPFIWTSQAWKNESRELNEKPWRKNYRIWALVLLILTLVMIFIFA